MSTYTAGSLVTSTATFVSTATGTATDPTTITLKYIVIPGGTETTYTYPNAFITRVSAGVYSAELDTTSLPGTWTVQWQGTGSVQAIADSGFTVVSALL